MHVEKIWETHQKVLEYAKKRHPKLYVITPPNYRSLGILPYSYRKFKEDVAKKYKELKEFCRMELHVHLNISPRFRSSDFRTKEKVIKDSFHFLEGIGVHPKEVVFGAYIWDEDCERAARRLGLKIIWPHFHIYDWWL